MSTDDGHSALQALHSMQRSITSNMRSLVSSSCGSVPDSAARSALARPRVECSSSRVAMKLGHMVPSVRLRQMPAPLHISTARVKPWSLRKARCSRCGCVRYSRP